MVTENIPFEDFGGSGDLLHFAHANAYPPGTYRAFLDLLSQSYRVLGIKHRPLWRDENPARFYSWEQIADDLITFCDQHKLHGLVGVGHSLGAVETMRAALKRPDLFRKLVLIEPVFLPPSALIHIEKEEDISSRSQWPWVATALRRRNHWPSREEAFSHFRKKKVFALWSDDVLWDYIKSGLQMTGNGDFELVYPREWEARIYTLPSTDVWNIIPQINQPTLAVRGIDSETLNPEAWSLWQKNQPQALFVELHRSGHLLPMERPESLAAVVLDFCKGQKK